MKKHFIKMRFKRAVRGLVDRTPIFEQVFIYLYKIFGSRPWSLGYSIYKFKEITDTIERKLNIFNDSQLPPQYGFGIDERIVEYPWVFSRLKKGEKMLLDAGGTLNYSKILKLQKLKDKNLHILTLHPEGEYSKSPFPVYKYEDLRKTSYGEGFFDAVVCLSTLEHVGMDNTCLYTPDETKKENDKYAYLEVVRELKRILKKNGTLYLTVPYGKKKNHRWFQVFDSEMVDKLISVFGPSEVNEQYFKYDKGQWNYADRQSCNNGFYFDIHAQKTILKDRLAAAQSIACLEMVK